MPLRGPRLLTVLVAAVIGACAHAQAAGAAVVINEIDCETDWVELVNTSATEADISGWLLTDDPFDRDPLRADHRYVFPDGTAIAGNDDLVVDKFNADRQAAKPNQTALQQQATQIQQIQASGEREIQQILAPVALSQAYVNEQIEDKLDAAVKSAMTKKKVSILLSPEAILAVNGGAYNLNQDILNELNAALPSAQLVPPSAVTR